MAIYKYEVGERILPPGNDSMWFQMDDGGGQLVIQLRRPSSKEKQAFKNGLSIQMAVVDQIIFILTRMGTMQWMDAPYYRKLSPNLTRLEYPEDGDGLAIHAMLVDGETGTLVAQKLISLATKTSQYLMAAIAAQPEIPDYDDRLNRVFSQYSTEDLLREASSIW